MIAAPVVQLAAPKPVFGCGNPACGRPVVNAFLCPGCLARLEQLLSELPAELRDLDVTITRQANAGRPESTSHGKPGTTVLYDPDDTASKVADQARNGLSSWVRHLCEQRGLRPPLIRTTPAMALWLTAHVNSIGQDEAAGDCYDAMRALRSAIRHAIDNLTRRWAGPCTAKILVADIISYDTHLALGEVRTECGADLRTRPGAKIIRCEACGAEYDPVERLRWILAKSREHHGTARFCANALTDAGYHVTVKQIGDLARRGRLISYRDSTSEYDRHGDPVPLYLLGDLIDFLDRDRRKVSA